MACDTHDIARDRFMLTGGLANQGYDWWWHSFTGHSEKTGEERAFFIEFFCVNPALGGSRSRVRPAAREQRATGAGRPTSWSSAAPGARAPRSCTASSAGTRSTWARARRFIVAADDCLCCETDLVGHVRVTPEEAAAHPEWMSDAGDIAFDLRLDKQIAFNVGYGASEPIRATDAFQMFWHAEGIKTCYTGEVWIDGERYVVDPATCYGYADKNWGRDFTSPWVWLSSNNLVSNRTGKRLEQSAFEIGGGRPKVGPLALDRKLLGSIVYEGTPYEFNFSKLWTGSQTHFACHETATHLVWHVEQETFNAASSTDVTCPKDEMLLVNYEAPNGDKKHNRLWNGGTGTGRVELYGKRGGSFFLIDDIAAISSAAETPPAGLGVTTRTLSSSIKNAAVVLNN